MLPKQSKFLLITSFLFLLSGCVTTSDSKLSRNADPDLAITRYVELGFEYIKREDFSRARKHLERALEIDEDNPAANSAIGLIYSRQGEFELAENAFKKALSVDSTYTRGRTYYAALLFSQSRFDDALEQFMRAAEDTTYTARSQIYTNIALCYVRLGNNRQAEFAYERSLQIDRFNAGSLAGITEVLISGNDYQRAQYYYNRLVSQIAKQALSHSAQTLWQGVRIALHFDAKDQASSLAALLKEQYPDSQEYRNYLSEYGG